MSNKCFLVEPDIAYRDQFAAMVAAYLASGEIVYINLYKEALEGFDQYIKKLQNNAKGIDVPADWVPSSTFWLTNEEGSILGTIRIRTSLESEYVRSYAGNIGYDISPLHRGKGYGKAILRHGLEKARALGLEKVLITCHVDNQASIKVIEGNGGVLEEEIFNEEHNTMLRRYWILLNT